MVEEYNKEDEHQNQYLMAIAGSMFTTLDYLSYKAGITTGELSIEITEELDIDIDIEKNFTAILATIIINRVTNTPKHIIEFYKEVMRLKTGKIPRIRKLTEIPSIHIISYVFWLECPNTMRKLKL